MLLTDTLIPDGDWYHLFYPLRVLIHEEFYNGHFPLWNPYTFSGSPLFASWQVAVLYPLNLLFIKLDAALAMKLVSTMNLVIAGLGMYLFTRKILSFSPVSCLVSSILFMFCGYFSVHFEHINQVNVGVWVPLLLYFFHRSLLQDSELSSSNPRINYKILLIYSLLGSVVFAIQVFGGHPQIIFYSMIIFIFYAITLIFHLYPVKKIHAFIPILISGTIIFGFGALLSIIQWLPVTELSGLSLRTFNTYERFSTAYSLPPFQLIKMILPNAFGDAPGNYYGDGNYTEFTGYMGIFSIILVALSLGYFQYLKKNRKLSSEIRFQYLFFIFLLTLFIASIFFAIGKYNPLYYWIYKIIIPFQYFRCPARMLFILNFAIALLAGFGWTFLETGILSKANSFARSWKKYIHVSTVIFILTAIGTWVIFFINKSQFTPNFMELLLSDITFLLVVLAVLYLIIYLLQKGKLREKTGLLFFVLLILLDLFVFSHVLPFHWLVESNRIQQFNPIAQSIHKSPEPSRLFRILDEVNYGIIAPSIVIERHHRLQPNLNVLHQVPDLMGYEEGLLPIGSYFYYIAKISKGLYSATPDHRLLSMMNVRFILADKPISGKYYRPIGFWNSTQLFENVNTLPLVYWVPDAVIFNDLNNHFQIRDLNPIIPELLKKTFSPSSTVILIKNDNQSIPYSRDTLDLKVQSDIRFNIISPTKIEVRTNTSHDGFLVFSISRYPGWDCWMDGEMVPTYRANGFASAVFLPKGEHTAHFEFQPRIFLIGKRISIVTGIVVILLMGICLINRKMTISSHLL